jgi:hypothetical protein
MEQREGAKATREIESHGGRGHEAASHTPGHAVAGRRNAGQRARRQAATRQRHRRTREEREKRERNEDLRRSLGFRAGGGALRKIFRVCYAKKKDSLNFSLPHVKIN